MRSRRFRGLLLVSCTFGFIAHAEAAQQDQGPMLTPKPKSKPTPAATLLVTCDLACNWKLDGEAKGHIDGGGSAKAKVELGQHMVQATTEDGADGIKQVSEVKSTGQVVVSFELQPVRDARLKSERETADRQTQAARDQAAREKEEREAAVGAIAKQADTFYDNKDWGNAQSNYLSACTDGNMHSCDRLGQIYDNGFGVQQNPTTAALYYQQACNGGNSDGCVDAGMNNIFRSVNPKNAVSLIQRACDAGNVRGCFKVGQIYRSGSIVPTDDLKAHSDLQRACDGGIPESCTSLAFMYFYGLGVTKDIEKAQKLWDQACKAGDDNGCSNLRAHSGL